MRVYRISSLPRTRVREVARASVLKADICAGRHGRAGIPSGRKIIKLNHITFAGAGVASYYLRYLRVTGLDLSHYHSSASGSTSSWALGLGCDARAASTAACTRGPTVLDTRRAARSFRRRRRTPHATWSVRTACCSRTSRCEAEASQRSKEASRSRNRGIWVHEMSRWFWFSLTMASEMSPRSLRSRKPLSSHWSPVTVPRKMPHRFVNDCSEIDSIRMVRQLYSEALRGTQRQSAVITHLLGDRFDPDGRAREAEHFHREVRAVPLGGDAQLRVHLAVVEHDGHVGEATQLEQQRV